MLTVHRKVTRRWVVVVVLTVMSVGSGAAANPAAPGQEDRPDSDDTSTDRALVGINSDAEAAELSSELDSLNARVDAQLKRLNEAERALDKAIADLADADSAVSETDMRLEELTARSDEIVISAFVNPPAQDALEVLSADTLDEATIKTALLDIQADASADVLSDLDAVRAELEELRAEQETALAKAEAARSEAEAALADLQAGVSQQAEFVMQVMGRDSPADLDAEGREREARLAAKLREMREAEEYAAALAKIAEAERRAAEAARAQADSEAAGAQTQAASSSSTWVCPVRGNVSFTDTWGAARSGGRTHKGTDMMAATGTPTVAPVSGRVEHRSSSLGGLSWYVYGDDGNTYYGTHLSGYANQGAGWVAQGTLIGYVGDSGNAAGTPHLHFEYHPGGGAPVNPYSRLVAAC
jgi:peptidoglycan LD-endopeptidase LytH